MQDTVVEDYGWTDSAPCSCSYLAPFVLELLGQLKVKRVLDLGAGNGVLCSMISAAGFDAVGVEYDPKGVEIARSRFPDNRFYSLGVQDDPERLMSREAPFDAVISTEVIEHLFSPHLLPQFARRTLSDDGYLIISTPYHGYLKNLALSIFNKWDFHHDPLWHGGHIKFWSRSTLTTLLERHGFRVTQFHGVGRLPYLWKTMVLVARKSPGPIYKV